MNKQDDSILELSVMSSSVGLLRKFVFRWRFEEFGSLIFILPIFFIILFSGHPRDLLKDAEKISLLIACILLTGIMFRVDSLRSNFIWKIIRDFGPLFYVLVIYSNLPWLINTLNPRDADAVLLKIDRFMFGVQPSVALQSWLFEPLISFATISYATYYFFPPLLAVLFYIRGKYKAFRYLSAAVLLSFFLGYVGYVLIPAVGPRYTIADQYTGQIEGAQSTQTIRQKLDEWEYTKRDCFPSLHIAIILVSLLFAFKYEKTFAWIFLPFAIGLFFGTVFLRYHYMIDAIAGGILAVGCFFWGPAIFHFWNNKQIEIYENTRSI